MDIGGVDIVLESFLGDATMDAAVRGLHLYWKDAVYEEHEGKAAWSRYEDIAFGGLKGLFVYCNVEAKKSWDDNGAIPANSNTMIYLIPEEGKLFLVVDEIDDRTRSMIETVRNLIQPGRHNPLFAWTEKELAA